MSEEAIKDPAGEGRKGAVEHVELSKRRQALARRIAESKATVPHLYLTAAADAGAERTLANVIAASARALREQPRLNGSYRDGNLELYSRVNVGFIAAGDDQIQPTVFDADRKPLGEIEAEIATLSGRAHDGSITAPETSGATFTVAAVEGAGINGFATVVNPPQLATLAVVLGASATLTLACDHRAVSAEEAAAFLGRVRELLSQPAEPQD